jgi:hypothetical protein
VWTVAWRESPFTPNKCGLLQREPALERRQDDVLGWRAHGAAPTGAEVKVEMLQRAPSASTAETDPAAVAFARCITAVERSSSTGRALPGGAGDAMVCAARDRRPRLWRRPARRLAVPGRVHRRGRDAPPSTRSSPARCSGDSTRALTSMPSRLAPQPPEHQLNRIPLALHQRSILAGAIPERTEFQGRDPRDSHGEPHTAVEGS